MTRDEATAVLAFRTQNMLQVQPVGFAGELVGLVCAVRPPDKSMVAPDGLARFQIRLDRAAWEALKVLVEAQLGKTQ